MQLSTYTGHRQFITYMPENTAPLSYTDTSAITAEVSHRVQEIQESSSKWNISDRTNLSQPWPYKGIK